MKSIFSTAFGASLPQTTVEDDGERLDERHEKDSATTSLGEIHGSMQPHDRLAGPSTSAYPCWSTPRRPHELVLLRVEEGHPRLDRPDQSLLQQRIGKLVDVEELVLGYGRRQDHTRLHNPHRPRGVVGRKRNFEDRGDLLDRRLFQSLTERGRPAGNVRVTDEADSLRLRVEALAAEHEQRAHGPRRQTQVRDLFVYLIRQRHHLVSLIVTAVVVAEEAVTCDNQMPPSLDVQHEDASWSDQQEIDVGPASPSTVRKHHPAELLEGMEPSAHRRFCPAGQRVALGLGPCLRSKALQFLGLEQGTLRLMVCRAACSHDSPSIDSQQAKSF